MIELYTRGTMLSVDHINGIFVQWHSDEINISYASTEEGCDAAKRDFEIFRKFGIDSYCYPYIPMPFISMDIYETAIFIIALCGIEMVFEK